MKCETTNTVLTFVLGVLALLGVIFALQTIFRTREYRSLTMQAAVANSTFMRVQALANDAQAYNQKSPNPELTRIIQSVLAKQPATQPATR
jgi:secreted Zn-dependent insulinase-like peptidase